MGYPNQYANYTEVPESEAAAFKASFQIPQICRRNNILNCDNAHRKGLLSAKSLRFVRAGPSGPRKCQNKKQKLSEWTKTRNGGTTNLVSPLDNLILGLCNETGASG